MPGADDCAVMLVIEGRAAEIYQPYVGPLDASDVLSLENKKLFFKLVNVMSIQLSRWLLVTAIGDTRNKKQICAQSELCIYW